MPLRNDDDDDDGSKFKWPDRNTLKCLNKKWRQIKNKKIQLLVVGATTNRQPDTELIAAL